MNNFNFFESYLDKTNDKTSSKNIIPILLIGLVFLSLFYYQWTLNQDKYSLLSEIDGINNTINEPERQSSYKKAVDARNRSEEIKIVLDEVEITINDLNEKFNISKLMVTSIIDEVPKNTYIRLIDYKDPLINITCTSDSYESAAQYIYNIKTSNEEFANVFMPSIDFEDGDYHYNLSVELGGDTDEDIK